MQINYERDELLPDFSVRTLEDRYLLDDETSPQQAFARAAKTFADDDDHAQRLYDYASQLWFMFSTPVLSNGGSSRGLPISCFLNYVGDSRGGIAGHYTENAWLSSVGGGIGGYWGDVRSVGSKTSRGSESTGVIPFLKVVDAEMLAFSQGVTRRGSYAAYLPIDHPEIEEFLDVRKPTGGDINRKSINLHHAVIISNKFMELIANEAKLKDRIRELEADDMINPWQKWIHLARAVDSWRIFPRIFVVVYIYLMYESVIWFMNLPEPNLEQSALVSVVVGAMGVVFGVYSGKSGQSKGFKGEDDN